MLPSDHFTLNPLRAIAIRCAVLELELTQAHSHTAVLQANELPLLSDKQENWGSSEDETQARSPIE
jgi:hypothetical protein